MNSKMKYALVLMAVSVSSCLRSQPASKNTDDLKRVPVVNSPHSEGIRVKIMDSTRFESLSSQIALDPQMRDGFSAFTENLMNEGDQTARIWFQARGGIHIETRIHEEANFHALNPVRVSRNRVSFADFVVDQLGVTRKSGESTHYSTQEWKSFDLSPGEQVHLTWVAHAKSDELCPFWEHHTYGGIGMVKRVPGALDWSIIGSSLVFQVARNLKAETGDHEATDDEPKGQSLIDSQDSAESNETAGDGTPNATDGHFSCDGLMELLPSN